jgi:hypothetical protein
MKKIALLCLPVLLLLQSAYVLAVEKYIERKMFSIKMTDEYLKDSKAYYIDDNENVYIYNLNLEVVDVYDKNGILNSTIKTDISYVPGENVNITANEHGNILIYSENMLMIYNKEGYLLKRINQKLYPQTLRFSDGLIYSLDTGKTIYEIVPSSKTAKASKQSKYTRDFSWNSNKQNQGESIVALTDKKEGKKINIPFRVTNPNSNTFKFQRVTDIDNADHIYVSYVSENSNFKNMIVKYDNQGNFLAKFEEWPLRVNQHTETVYSNKYENGYLSFYKWEKMK